RRCPRGDRPMKRQKPSCRLSALCAATLVTVMPALAPSFFAPARAAAVGSAVLRSSGCGALFSQPSGSPVAVGTNPESVAVGDFNHDGNPDLATANQTSNDVTILLGDGAG